MKETELAAAIVAYFRDMDFDVHQEVGGSYGPRADIVAKRGPILHVVEVKMSLGLAVVAQADGWRKDANRVSVAVPRVRRDRARHERSTVYRVLRLLGIGLYEATNDWRGWRIHEELTPDLRRRTTDRLSKLLCDGTRTYAEAGNADGKFWSPFKDTCEQMRRAVAITPGLTTKELVAQLKHHYSSDSVARATLPRWLRAGKIPGLRGEGDRPTRWFLAA